MPVRKSPSPQPRRRWLVGGLVVAPLILAGVVLGAFGVSWPTADPATAIGGPFSLRAADGRAVTERSFAGKWLLVFFGYTRCPDICPTTLGDVAQALARLGPLADRIQPLFVTVDPDHDTPEALRRYTAAFGDRILGLTGSPAQIAAMVHAYRGYYAPGAPGGEAAIAHSGVLYVMRPGGAYAGYLPRGIAGAVIADKLKGLVGQG